MGSSSQRKKERHAKKRKEKRKKQEQARQQGFDRRAEVFVGSNARHRERLAQQVPHAWPGEAAEDVAVFDDAALGALAPEVGEQATAVREALREALESRGDEALKRLSAISRNSPLSEWRLYIRGLVDWLAGRADAAGETWKRLDPQRRPRRIAAVMMGALRSDLEQLAPVAEQPAPSGESEAPAWNRMDAQQLYHAKLLRRVRFERAALRIAETGVSAPEGDSDVLLGPKKIEWLKRFIAEYEETEPDLTAALAHTALGRAFAQDYSDMFEEAVRTFPGPRHDRRNRVLTFLYYGRFNDRKAAQRAEQALDEYLNRDLPQNTALSAPLRSAIASQIHLYEAHSLIRPNQDTMFGLMFAPPEDSKAIQNHLRAAIKAYPQNGPAHRTYVDWVKSRLDDDRLTKARRESLEKELADVMQKWSSGMPDQVEPRLWLVDHLLENEQLEQARPHVEFLAAARQDDPRVRALPWKWQILEAMRLCRRKAWLAEVPARLDEAEGLWPSWLSRQWLPYLRAAWMVRHGQTEAYEAQRRQIGETPGLERDSLPDACMMLGAAQQMRVPAPELKPFREALDRALKQIDTLPLEDLIETGGFFWDLHRAQLLYPAYRMHGKAIGTALFARLAKNSARVLDNVDDERVHKAVLWGSEWRYWSTNYETSLPAFFANPATERHPIFIAARVNAFLKQTYRSGSKKCRGLELILREAAPRQRDAYYRYWFAQLADELDDALAAESSLFRGFPFGGPFGSGGFDDDDFDDDDFDDDDDLGFDPNCNCPDCRAARKRAEQQRSK